MRIPVAIVGAGHAGLAMSRRLAEQSIDHVALERGEVANSWKTQRWESLRLLTPNWQSRLPGFGYQGNDPDGYRTMAETIAFIERYAQVISAPVHPHTTVTSVRRRENGFEVLTDQGVWLAQAVVLAGGACNLARLPPAAAELPPAIRSMTPLEYRNPAQLDPGGVMVVGAAASGIQIAHEVRLSGRPVVLSVGEHVRVPRTYRGKDIKWWLDTTGILDERYDEVDDIRRARNLSSLQLIGCPDHRSMDLNALREVGVKIVGRLAGIVGDKVHFSGSLPNHCMLADLKMNRLLNTIDEWATRHDLDRDMPLPHRFEPTRVDPSPELSLRLNSGDIKTVIWATGFRPDHSWLHVDVFDRKGRVRHDGGVTPCPGLYLLGQHFLRRRKSSLIDGAGDDARDLCEHLVAHFDRQARPAPPIGAIS